VFEPGRFAGRRPNDAAGQALASTDVRTLAVTNLKRRPTYWIGRD
jgi:hypothetical protein